MRSSYSKFIKLKNHILVFNNFLSNTLVFNPIVFRIIFLSLLLYTMLHIAWVNDDAHFTFKQIINFINGQGIVYNFDTRVQGFTHPLWFIVLSVFIFFTNDVYITTIVLSIFLSFFSVVLLLIFEKNTNVILFRIFSPIYLLLFSWAFCEYTTSGLENPLSYFLVGCLFYCFTKNKNLIAIFIILALLVLTRFDYGIIFFPLALVLALECKNVRFLIISILPGTVLLLIWHTFSTIYFGTPLPNTFYAKMFAGYPVEEYYKNGINYILNMKYDLSSILVIISSIFISFFTKNRYIISISIGQFLYLIYIITAGGDFMSGRFFAILVFLSIGNLILISSKINKRLLYNSIITLLIFMTFILGFSLRFPVLAPQYHTARMPIDWSGAIDERSFFYAQLGLLSKHRNGWPKIFSITNENPTDYHIQCGGLGTFAFENSNLYAIDSCALIDPFLSRMPAVQFNSWRPGHNYRKIPTNFGEYLIQKENSVKDEMLTELFKDIDLIVRGNLLTFDRFKAIWRLNTNFDYGVNWEKYMDPEYWITTSEYFQSEYIESWDTPLKNIVRNQNWKVSSKTPKVATKILIDIAFEYRFNVYINDKFILTLDEGIQCKGGKLVVFPKPMRVHSIKFIAVSMKMPGIPTSTGIKQLQILGLNDDISDIESNCRFGNNINF